MPVLPTFTSLGAGPTVLMLHDADGGHLCFAPQVETLASAGYRAVAWDMPGYGYSAPVEPYAAMGLARACLGLIDALAAAPITLVGHGMGAMLALDVALRAGARIGRLVLCAGGPPLDDQALAQWCAPRERALAAHDTMEQVAAQLVPQQIGTAALPEGVRLAEHALTMVHRATYLRALQALPGLGRPVQGLADSGLPILVMGGAQDRTLAPAALAAMAASLPQARYLVLDGVGHWPQLEAPEAFDGALLDFLATTARVMH